jgi:hypothetical protein
MGGTAAQLSAERHNWEEAVVTFRTWTTMEQALKTKIIMVFEPIYLEILNNDMVGFANTFARDMLENLFLSYGSIAAVDLECNCENMSNAWDPQQPVKTLFKKIQDSVDYAEAGGVTISEENKLQTDYAKIFSTGKFHSACHRWNKRNYPEQTWNNFKNHFVTSYRQHNKIQGETAAASRYANAAVSRPANDDFSGADIYAFANLATANAVDRGIVSNLTDAISHLTKQLEETSQTLKETRALLKKERNDHSSRKLFTPSIYNYCWTHGYKIARNRTSER